MTGPSWLAWGAALTLLLGLALVIAGRGIRRRRGLSAEKTVVLDNVTLISRRYGLACKPDRLVRSGGMAIPEEWKSARKVWPSHVAQLGAAFLVIDDRLRARPTHGFVVTGDGQRHRIENSDELRAWVLDVAVQIRAARRAVDTPIPVNPTPRQCAPCGLRGQCGQARWERRGGRGPSSLPPPLF